MIISDTKSHSQVAYEEIRRLIVTLALEPGAVINEQVLQTDLNLGRTPIREALQRLSREKLVTIVPRRGMFVTDIGVTDLQRLTEVRQVLEPLAARLAAARGSSAIWDEMGDLLNETDGLSSEDANQFLIELDEKCHLMIYEAAGNSILKDNLTQLYALSLRLWQYVLGDVGDIRPAVEEHRQIYDALRAGDADKAGDLMEAHIHHFEQQIQAVMFDR